MKAAFYRRKGPADEVLEIGEVDCPDPQHGELTVRLHTSGINPSDVKSRARILGADMPYSRIVPHSDGAGEVVAVGPDVPKSRIGERVWVWNGQWRRAMGTAAEYITLPAAQAVALPEGIGYEIGACLGIPALTACHAVRLAGASPEKTLIVTGGAGAVGHYAIQMAKLAGARVIATVSGSEKAAHARAAGADDTINYRTQDVAAQIHDLTAGGGADAIIDVDVAANIGLLPTCLKPHGIFLYYGYGSPSAQVPVQAMLQKSITLRSFLVYDLAPGDRREAEATLRKWLQQGELRHTIAARYPLDCIAEAHQAVEAGQVLGNVVLDN